MKHYIYNGETYDKIPNPLRLADGSMISPVSEELFLAQGGEIEEDGEPTHFEELCDACDKFVANVLDIQEFIGDTSFLGGIDQMDQLDNSTAAQEDPMTALKLAQRWAATNTRCNFFADKPDLYDQYHSPVWFYFAWSRFMETLKPTQTIEAPAE